MPQIDDAKLKELVLISKSISKEKLAQAEELSHKLSIPLRDALVQKEITDDISLGTLEAGFYKLPFVSLLDIEIPDEVLFSLPEEVARRNKVVLFSRSDAEVKLATSEPSPQLDYLVRNLEKKTGKKTILHYLTPRELDSALYTYKKNLQY